MAESFKSLFCTLDGINRIKKILGACTGATVIAVAVVELLTPSNWSSPFSQFRNIWNLLFGALMIILQVKPAWVVGPFGFLNRWPGRSVFFLFVGTTVWDDSVWWSFIVGGFCICVAGLEFLLGCKGKSPIAKPRTKTGDVAAETSQTRGSAPDRISAEQVRVAIATGVSVQQSAQSSPWQQLAAEDGTKYFHHTVTGQTSWTDPEAGGAPPPAGPPSDNPFSNNAHLAEAR
jgi:hypothetical protein